MTSHSLETDNEENFKDELQSFRFRIVETISFEKMKAALLSISVIDNDDSEEISNRCAHPTTRSRLNRFVDMLLRKGEGNYKKFLEVLGHYYPHLYKEITGVNPNRSLCADLRIGDAMPDDCCQVDMVGLLMQALDQMKQNMSELSRQHRRCTPILNERTEEADRLKQKVDDLTQRVARYENMDNDNTTLRKEIERLKSENLSICMRVIETNGENAGLRTLNMNLKNEIDKTQVELQKLKGCVALERNQSIRLRKRLQTRPSDQDLMDMKMEIDELRLKLAHASNQQIEVDSDMQIQILQRDKDEALEMYAEAIGSLNKLREDFTIAQTQKEQYLGEKEQLELECTSLRNDCNMYKTRRDSIWQQLQEVEKEREVIMKERNDAQLFSKVCIEEKTRYRTQIREMEETRDKLSQEMLECNKKLACMQRQRNHEINLWYSSNKNEVTYPTSTASSESNPCHLINHPFVTDSSHNNIMIKVLFDTFDLPQHKTALNMNLKNEIDKTQVEVQKDADRSQFRTRTYITKYYKKFASKSRTSVEDMSDDVSNGFVNLFSEVPLAADYGPNDAESLSSEYAKRTSPFSRRCQPIKRPGKRGNETRGKVGSVSSNSRSSNEVAAATNLKMKTL